MPLISAPLPTGTDDERRCRKVAAVHGVGHLDGHRAGAGCDPLVLAVDEQLGAMLGRVGFGFASGRVEVVAMLDDGRPEGAHPGDLGAVRAGRAEHDRGQSQGAGRIGDPLAEVPGRHAHDRAVRPIRPSAARPSTATQVPRPLNERIGFDVSILTITGLPQRALRPSWTYCGESRNAAGMRAWAARMASGSSAGSVRIAVTLPGAAGRDPDARKRPKELPVRSRRRRCKHLRRRFRSGCPFGQDRLYRPATWPGKGTYPRVSGEIAVPRVIVHSLSTKPVADRPDQPTMRATAASTPSVQGGRGRAGASAPRSREPVERGEPRRGRR